MPNHTRDLRILIGCDSVDTTLAIVKYLSGGKQSMHYVRVDSASAIKLALKDDWDVFICDLHMEKLASHDVFLTLHELAINVPLVLLCRQGERNDIAMKALAISAVEVVEITQLAALEDCVREIVENAQNTSSLSDNQLSWQDLASAVMRLNTQWQILDCNQDAKRLLLDAEESFFKIWQDSSRLSLQQLCRSFALGNANETTIGSVAEPLQLQASSGYYIVHIKRISRADAVQYSAVLQDIGRDVDIYQQRLQDQQELKDQYSDTLARLSESQKRDTDTLLAKTQFLSQVGHEIRTPMNAISGFAEALSQRALDPQSKVLANRISRASSMLLSVVNDLLDFSKIEANQLQIQREPFFLNDVLDDLAFIMSGSAKAKHLELSIVGPEQQFTYLEGDDLRLKQVLINLAANAIKFTETGAVTLGVEQIKREAGHINYKFSVKDSGIGMSPEQITKIMEPFVQANVEISRRYGGTGLGLTICRSLVEKMGGELKVNSQLGKGTTFYFTLGFPLLPYPAHKLQKLTGVKVLIADDNSIALQGLEATVAAMNWQSVAFASGVQLLETLQRRTEWHGPHCLVLLDWNMPGLDGFEAAERINDMLPPEKRPIIFMVTSRESEQLASNPASQYVDRILDKPLSPGVLYDAMQNAMDDRGATVNSAEIVPRLKGYNILVVEDSDLNLELVKSILSDEGANVESAINGKEALTALNKPIFSIDLVLLDLQLPDMDGFAIATAIRAKYDSEALPVICMTARDSAEDRLRARQVGMDDWISKPLNSERLVLLIQQYCQHHSKLQPGQELVVKQDATARFIRLRWERLPLLNSKSPNIVTHEHEVYRRLLQKFIHNYLKQLQALEMGELDDNQVTKLAHKLRGGSLSLGLERLSELCLVFEEFASQKISFRPNNEELAYVLRQSVETIKPMLEEAPISIRPSQNNADVDPASLQACLLEGITLLQTYNPEQIQPFLKDLEDLGMGKLLDDINHQLDDYDFNGAVRLVMQHAKMSGIALDRGQSGG